MVDCYKMYILAHQIRISEILPLDRMVLGHFGHGHSSLGRFGTDISATDISVTENVEGGRFSHNHKFWVWDVCINV